MRINMRRHTADGWHIEIIQSKKWDANDDQSKHTPVSAAVFKKIMADFTRYGENCPQILSINSFDLDFHYQCEIEIQLPGGVVMEVASQTSFGTPPVPETLAEASDEAAELVSDLVGYYAGFGFEKLTDKFDDARSGLNKLFEQWSNDGDAQIHLVDLRIRTDPHWQYTFDIPVQITINCLGEALFPADMHIDAWDPEGAVAELMEFHAEIKTRTQAKTRLETQGADGFIDLIAMNSLLLVGSIKARPEDYLPKLREPELHPDFEVKYGRFYLDATDVDDARITWQYDSVQLSDLEILT